MKKILFYVAMFCLLGSSVSAETIIVVDQKGNVLQNNIISGQDAVSTQIITSETYRTVPVNTTIINPTPVTNTRYYENISVGDVIIAGITTGIVGGLIYHSIKHDKSPKAHHFAPHKPFKNHRRHHG